MQEHDKLAFRLVEIISRLNDGEVLHISELAEKFQVSKRTIHRDIKRLNFMDLEQNKGKISLSASAKGNIQFKDLRDFLRLCGMNNLFPKLEDGALRDLINPKLNTSLFIRPAIFEKVNEKSKEFDALQVAILNRQIITFHYNQKERTIHPYKLAHYLGVWYLLGTEEENIKSFALNKIRNLIVLEKSNFNHDPALLQEIEEKKFIFLSKNKLGVTLFIDSYAMPYFERRSIFPDQKILHKDQDGMEIQIQSSYDEETLRIIQQWMPHIIIISPDSLRDKLKERMKDYLQTMEKYFK